MAGMADTFVSYGVGVYIVTLLFGLLGLNTGSYATLTGQILPVIGVVLGAMYIKATATG